MSGDPLAAKYPFYSPYAFSGNRVLDAVELEGAEPVGLPSEYTKVHPVLKDGTPYFGTMGGGEGYSYRTYGVLAPGENGTPIKGFDNAFFGIKEKTFSQTGGKEYSYFNYETRGYESYRTEIPQSIVFPEFVLEVGAKFTAGLDVGVEGNYGDISMKARVNIVNAEFFSFSDDFVNHITHYDVIGGENGVLLSNSISFKISEQMSGLGLGGFASQSQQIIGGRSRNYQKDAGLYLGLQPRGNSSRRGWSWSWDKPSPSAEVGKSKDFYGINAGVGASAGIGGSISVKMGFKTNK
ncbi:MAG: hypothetical protein R3C61_28445 [Bacteroidia bacterium]